MSSESYWEGEADFIQKLLPDFDCVHIRKPLANSDEVKRLMQHIPTEFHPKLVNHGHIDLWNEFNWRSAHFSKKNECLSGWQGSHSFSCHSFHEIKEKSDCEYVFLSPIFNSISKEDHLSNFRDLDKLKSAISELKKADFQTKIIALGGITPDREKNLLNLGFDGVCYKGALKDMYA